MVYNDERMHELVKRAAAKVVGEENLATKKRGLGGEDFSYFANEKPGYMFRLGIRNNERGITHGAHTDRFDLDEGALKYGVEVFTQFILDNMGGIDF
jgi:amidohydrolase